MKPAKLGLGLFFASVFLFILSWGYIPKLWVQPWFGLSVGIASVVGLLVFFAFSLPVVVQWFKKRSTQFTLGLTLMAAGSLAMLGAVNFVVAKYYNKKWDLTQSRVHTLSDQTLRVLKELKEEVVVEVWTTSIQKMSQSVDLRRFLENYEMSSGGKLKVEIKNPVEEPFLAKQLNIRRENVMIVRAKSGRETRIENFNDQKSEEQLTNAIIQVRKAEGAKKAVCFVSGHGQLGLNDSSPQGLSTIKTKLQDAGYEPKEVQLGGLASVPKECELVLVVGPKSAPLEKEIQLLQSYLQGGGKLVTMFGPGTPSAWLAIPESYGVRIQRDVVLDRRVDPPVFVLTQNYAQDVDITRGFANPVLLPEVSSIQLPTANSFQGATLRPFVSTESTTISRAGDLRELANPRALQQLRGSPGPFTVGVLVTKPVEKVEPAAKPESVPGKKVPSEGASQGWFNTFVGEAHAQEHDGHNHSHGDGHDHGDTPMAEGGGAPSVAVNEMNLVVFGNHNFVMDSIVGRFGNLDLFLNTVSFLMKDGDTIGIRPREIKSGTLEVTEERLRQVTATVVLIGLIFLVSGVAVYSRRRSAV